MRARIELLLKQQKLTKKNIKDILQVYVLSWRFHYYELANSDCLLLFDIFDMANGILHNPIFKDQKLT